jgi:hypothetical protein
MESCLKAKSRFVRERTRQDITGSAWNAVTKVFVLACGRTELLAEVLCGTLQGEEFRNVRCGRHQN